jgi:hypothetical protein
MLEHNRAFLCNKVVLHMMSITQEHSRSVGLLVFN